MFMSQEIEFIKAAQWLAQHGTAKNIMRSMMPKYERYVSVFGKPTQRHALNWVRSSDGFLGDRAIRLFAQLFTINAINKPMQITELCQFTQTYITRYPSDEMTANRLHYMIQSIRSGEFIVKEKCKCCGKIFVVHRDDSLQKECHICKTIEQSL